MGRIYNLLNNMFLTRGTMLRLYNQINLLYPTSKNAIKLKVMRIVKRLVIAMVPVGIVLGLMYEANTHNIIIILLVIYTIINNRLNKILAGIDNKLTKQLEQFLTDVRFRYQYDGMLEEAILDSINNADYEMSIHGEQIYEYLMKNDEEDIYKDIAPNKFFMIFYTMCETLYTYGDSVVNGESMFVINLGYLKEDINNELLKRNKVKNAFLGLSGLSILPLFAIKPIELWASSNMDNVKSMYTGKIGLLSTILITVLALLIYKLIGVLQATRHNNSYRASYIRRISNNRVIDSLIMKHIYRHFKKYSRMNVLLRSIVYRYNLKEFIIERVAKGVFFGIAALVVMVSINVVTNGVAIELFDVIISILIGIGIYLGIYIKLCFSKQLLLLDREEEIVNLQTIIIIMMNTDRISVDQIIECMQEYSLAFRVILREISDKLSYMGMKVFDLYKNKSGFLPFDRLMDSFYACDSVGIKEGLKNIETDRSYYLEKHKQDNEQMINNKAQIAKVISFIPLCTVIIVKVIIPFVLVGINELGNLSM